MSENRAFYEIRPNPPSDTGIRTDCAAGTVIRGVGKGEPIVTNEQGGQQSATHYRFDLLPPRALAAVAAVLHDGIEVSGYVEWNWLKIDSKSHLNKAMIHINAYLAGDRTDDHMEHATCRMLMAMEMVIRERDNTGLVPRTDTANA